MEKFLISKEKEHLTLVKEENIIPYKRMSHPTSHEELLVHQLTSS